MCYQSQRSEFLSSREQESEVVQRIAAEALSRTSNGLKQSTLAQELAKREARRAARELIRPFYPEEPPGRPSDKLTPIYFEVPTNLSPGPVLPVSTGKLPKTKQEQQKANSEFFALIFREANLTLEDFTNQRIRVFFRLARELANHIRILNEEELLNSLPIESWTKQLTVQRTTGRYKRTSDLLSKAPLALLPPPPNTTNADSYDPEQDAPLKHYCQALECLGEDLSIRAGTKKEPHLGRYGLLGLLDPAQVRLACPSPQEVMDWEATLVQDAYRKLVGHGTDATYAWLHQQHGLMEREARPLVRAAREQALNRSEQDIEVRRAMQNLRLEGVARRGRAAANLSAQLKAEQLQAVINGLARSEPENAITEFVGVVKKINSADKPAKAIEMDEDADEP
jgi:hypothetical protein